MPMFHSTRQNAQHCRFGEVSIIPHDKDDRHQEEDDELAQKRYDTTMKFELGIT